MAAGLKILLRSLRLMYTHHESINDARLCCKRSYALVPGVNKVKFIIHGVKQSKMIRVSWFSF